MVYTLDTKFTPTVNHQKPVYFNVFALFTYKKLKWFTGLHYCEKKYFFARHKK